MKNAILSIKGTELSNEERIFFREHKPYGLILFSANIRSKEQLSSLMKSFAEIDDEYNPLIFVDQEGGRVTRIKPPIFSRELPPAGYFAKIYENNPELAIKMVYYNYLLIAIELKELGFSGCFAPVADISYPVTHKIIGDRSFGTNPEQVISLAQSAYNGLEDAGIIGCIKHIPGHGLAISDSHLELPHVKKSLEYLDENDFKVFKELNAKAAMTAHIVYETLDKDNPVTTSKDALNYIKQNIFNGVLISDALEMKALNGSFTDRAQKSIDAGIDILLHCNGNLAQMHEVISVCSEMDKSLLEKLNNVKTIEYNFTEILSIYSQLQQQIELQYITI